MPILNLKTSHKPVREYYKELKQFEKLGVSHEGAVKTAFQKLLKSCGKQFNWTLVQEWQIKLPGKRAVRVHLAKRTIYQHFGNKAELFDAVIHRLLSPKRDRCAELKL